jgi:DNA-binding CsgD family transcriptional regulator
LDRIYECSFAPETWPDALEDISNAVGAAGGAFSVFGPRGHFWTASSGVREIMDAMVDVDARSTGLYAIRMLEATRYSFAEDHDLFTAEEIAREPVYRELILPVGLRWGIGATIEMTTGETILVGWRRKTELGPYDRRAIQLLNDLRPHLARSAMVAARLQLERARAAGQTLAALGLAALVVDADGKILAANELIEAQGEIFRWQTRDAFSFKDAAAAAQFGAALASIDVDSGVAARSFPVRDAEGRAATVAHVVPIRRSARDIFARCAAALILTPVATPLAPSVDLVQSLFDLTPTEAAVAAALARGKTVDDIAVEGGLARSTIRTHVRGVLEKTGCDRQSQVISLLASVSIKRG